ncbi:hypothetical protein V8G54_009177 [Vigna mungo]|uniref:Uncharacterized protein n=1 Tax=Vigna mungo TaxID=3915 RepID=A0AAQ3NVM0_VIGMU
MVLSSCTEKRGSREDPTAGDDSGDEQRHRLDLGSRLVVMGFVDDGGNDGISELGSVSREEEGEKIWRRGQRRLWWRLGSPATSLTRRRISLRWPSGRLAAAYSRRRRTLPLAAFRRETSGLVSRVAE